MTALEQLFKILMVQAAILAAGFFIFLQFHNAYRKMSAPRAILTIFVIHLVNCLIMLRGFYAAEHLRQSYLQQYPHHTEMIHGMATFFLLFLLGLPFIYFYIQAQLSSGRLEEENHAHKLDVINFMSRVMEELPEDLKDHAAKTSLLVKEFCEFLELDPEVAREIVFASMFHNVGAAFKANPETADSKVTAQERDACLGAALLSGMSIYKNAALIIRHCHENWDGSGIPDKLRGAGIPVGSRIIAIVSRYDQLLTGLEGQPTLSSQGALAKLNEGSGSLFSPDLLKRFNSYALGEKHLKKQKKSFGDRTDFK